MFLGWFVHCCRRNRVSGVAVYCGRVRCPPNTVLALSLTVGGTFGKTNLAIEHPGGEAGNRGIQQNISQLLFLLLLFLLLPMLYNTRVIRWITDLLKVHRAQISLTGLLERDNNVNYHRQHRGWKKIKHGENCNHIMATMPSCFKRKGTGWRQCSS